MNGPNKSFNINYPLEIQRLELALESAGVGTWEFKPESNTILWCHRAQKLFSSDIKDVIDFDQLLQRITASDRDAFYRQISTAIYSKVPSSFSLEFRTEPVLGESCRWIHCKAQAHLDNSNEARILGTFTDITKEVNNRNLLIEKQRKADNFEIVFEQAPMAIGLLEGPDFIIAQGNEKIFEVWGKPSTITGMKLADALPEIKGQQFLTLLTQVYATGLPYFGYGVPAQLERNSELTDVYFDFVYTPVFSGSGSVMAVMVMAHDVTSKYNALEELRQNEAKFKALIEQAPVSTSLFTGDDMIIELANKSILDYWGKDDLVIGKPLSQVLPELANQPFLEILHQVRQTGTPYSSENAAVNFEINGKIETRFFNFTYKPVFDYNGNVYGIINMSIDVTTQVQTQRALLESESKLRTIIESAPAAIGLFVGRELVVQLPNQAFIEIVGKGPDIIGLPLAQVMPELDSQPFLKILDDVYTSGVTYKSFGTQVNILRQGVMTYNFYDITYSPVYDSEGNIYAILDIATEVTERVQIEKKIQQSQLDLLSLFEESPIGIAMIRKENLTFTMANTFYGKLVGRNPSEIVGLPLIEALPEIKGQGFDFLLENVFETGIPYTSPEQAVDINYDGVIKTIFVNLAYQPKRDVQGNITGILVVATELTDQVLSRKKIEEAQAFLQVAVDLAELGTYSIDLQTGVLNYSDRLKHWFGVNNHEVLTIESAYSAICEEDRSSAIDAFARASADDSDGLYNVEYTMDAEKTGAARMLHVQGKVLSDETGKPSTMIGTAQDITVQRKIKLALETQVQERTEELAAINEELAAMNEEYLTTNEELAESNDLLQISNINLQQFAYVASHDLQEPLRKIQAFSNLLLTRHSENLGDGINYLNRMQAAARRMSDLINDLLSFSRITTQIENNDVVSLNKILSEVLVDLELSITESKAKIDAAILPEILGDASQLRQLFHNLLSNALKFTKSGVDPIVQITLETVGADHLPSTFKVTKNVEDFYKINITDNGIGFEQQYADRIFQLFQRLHGRSEYPGTGIGLAICERVASNHGGSITVKSEPGEGTCFSIFFPVSKN